MNLIDAIVHVQTERYTGPAIVVSSNGDDTVKVLEEQTGHEFCVHKDALTVAPVTEQSLPWISRELLAAWQPFLTRLTRHLAERLRDYARFGAPDQADTLFHAYLNEPERAFRSLCRLKE